MSFTDVHPVFVKYLQRSQCKLWAVEAMCSQLKQLKGGFFGVADSLQLISLSEPATSIHTHFPYEMKLTGL